jgi:DNA polymerase III delta prime subunit
MKYAIEARQPRRAQGPIRPFLPILAGVITTDHAPGFTSLGQPAARRMALRGLATGRIGHSLLVHGPAGAGKDAFVDDLLALVLCADADASRRPCNACRGCRDARERSHPDLVIGSPERWRESRSTGESIVAAARRWLLEAAGAPVVADRRVIVIEHADQAGEQIQNALLKALEEPTDRHLFILVADDASSLLPTIRSRCQPMRLGPVPLAELRDHLMDVERLPEDQAVALARISGGLAGTAISYARDGQLLGWRRRTQLQLTALLERGRAERFASVRDLIDEAAAFVPARGDDEEARTPASVQREAALRVVTVWIGLSRDLLVAAAGRAELTPSAELADELGDLGRRIGVAPLLAMLEHLERVHAGLGENAAPRLALESAMLRWPMLAPAGVR